MNSSGVSHKKDSKQNQLGSTVDPPKQHFTQEITITIIALVFVVLFLLLKFVL